jgi:hypothetical protein
VRLPIEIEDIDYLRRKEGIDDVELHDEIRALRIGDYVRLTFLVRDRFISTGETLLVRITRIQGQTLSGRLTNQPISRGLAKLRIGARVSFAASHIHSVAAAPPQSRTSKKELP